MPAKKSNKNSKKRALKSTINKNKFHFKKTSTRDNKAKKYNSNKSKNAKESILFVGLEKWEEDYLKKYFPNAKFSETLASKNLSKFSDTTILGVFVHTEINSDIIDRLKNLRIIVTLSTGFDHIDLETCKRKNITVCNVPKYGQNTVAEHAFALILSLARKLYKIYPRTKQGNFSLAGLRGFDLKGKRLGVIGCGNIGQNVAKIANGFEMKVQVYDLIHDNLLAKKLNFKYVDLEKLLSSSDIITIHVPYNKHTHHMINKENIKLFKQGSYLVNTARGEVVDTSALLYGLKHDILAGAALDVLEEECFLMAERKMAENQLKICDAKVALENHMLLMQENVIITPHTAFNTKEALERIFETAVKNIESFRKGKLINKVV